MRRYDDPVSPYLKKPLRSLEEVLRQRAARRIEAPPRAHNRNGAPPPAKSGWKCGDSSYAEDARKLLEDRDALLEYLTDKYN